MLAGFDMNISHSLCDWISTRPGVSGHEFIEKTRTEDATSGIKEIDYLQCERCGYIDPVPTNVEFKWRV